MRHRASVQQVKINMIFNIKPIGILHTCYKEKFGIPRQPNLVQAPGTLIFSPEFAKQEAVRELDGFSHIWLIFAFHENVEKGWSPMVRPPRLGGNKKVGVFASRSPFRPNPIGMSPVRLESVEIIDNSPVLHLSGVDILDQTPILDIKPYIPYSDAIPDALGGFAKKPPEIKQTITFSDLALSQIKDREKSIPDLMSIITGILGNDPRPAYQSDQNTVPEKNQVYGIHLFDFDLKWAMKKKSVFVIELAPPLR